MRAAILLKEQVRAYPRLVQIPVEKAVNNRCICGKVLTFGIRSPFKSLTWPQAEGGWLQAYSCLIGSLMKRSFHAAARHVLQLCLMVQDVSVKGAHRRR